MGSWGAREVRSGDPGGPGPEGFHRWCELDVVGVLGKNARLACVDETFWGWLLELVGAAFGGRQGSGQASSIVVQCVDRQPG